jgi:hypothetical protein
MTDKETSLEPVAGDKRLHGLELVADDQDLEVGLGPHGNVVHVRLVHHL